MRANKTDEDHFFDPVTLTRQSITMNVHIEKPRISSNMRYINKAPIIKPTAPNLRFFGNKGSPSLDELRRPSTKITIDSAPSIIPERKGKNPSLGFDNDPSDNL
jgi:hypothetical protein